MAAGGLEKTYRVKDAAGGVRKQSWHFPSRNECMFCHSRAAGFVLGLTTAQMNRPQRYGAVEDNQLRALEHIGLFKTPPPLNGLRIPIVRRTGGRKSARAHVSSSELRHVPCR